jgi:hypothetical protein
VTGGGFGLLHGTDLLASELKGQITNQIAVMPPQGRT